MSIFQDHVSKARVLRSCLYKNHHNALSSTIGFETNNAAVAYGHNIKHKPTFTLKRMNDEKERGSLVVQGRISC